MSALTDRCCEVCGVSLDGRSTRARWCSARCRAAAWRRDHGLAALDGRGRCLHCDGPIPETRRSDARYCCKAHRLAAARARRALTVAAVTRRDDRLDEIAKQLAALALELHQLTRSATTRHEAHAAPDTSGTSAPAATAHRHHAVEGEGTGAQERRSAKRTAKTQNGKTTESTAGPVRTHARSPREDR